MSVDELIKWDCPMADNVLGKKCMHYCKSSTNDEKDFEYTPMTLEKFSQWTPNEDDIMGLVESIKFWSNCKPKGKKEETSDKEEIQGYIEKKIQSG